jgi:hypothetical protein
MESEVDRYMKTRGRYMMKPGRKSAWRAVMTLHATAWPKNSLKRKGGEYSSLFIVWKDDIF